MKDKKIRSKENPNKELEVVVCDFVQAIIFSFLLSCPLWSRELDMTLHTYVQRKKLTLHGSQEKRKEDN